MQCQYHRNPEIEREQSPHQHPNYETIDTHNDRVITTPKVTLEHRHKMSIAVTVFDVAKPEHPIEYYHENEDTDVRDLGLC